MPQNTLYFESVSRIVMTGQEFYGPVHSPEQFENAPMTGQFGFVF